MDVNLNMYDADAYSSTSGGDMEVIGTMVHRTRLRPAGGPSSRRHRGRRTRRRPKPAVLNVGRACPSGADNFIESVNIAVAVVAP